MKIIIRRTDKRSIKNLILENIENRMEMFVKIIFSIDRRIINTRA